MRTTYNKTTWVDNQTPINACNLNNIERGIENLYNNSLSVSDLVGGDGINVADTESGIKFNLAFNPVSDAPVSSTSNGNTGDYFIDDSGEDIFLYFCIKGNSTTDNAMWIKIKLERF